MNKYFTQIPLNLDMLDTNKLTVSPFRNFKDETYYFKIENPEYQEYLQIFKELKFRDVLWCQFPQASPHIDHDDSKCAINHYYITQNAETVYYQPKPNAKPYAGVNEVHPCFYNKEDVIEDDKFCADPGSLWLLDVTKIHSLEFPCEFGPLRTFVKWRFDAPYEEVYDKLFNNLLPKLNK